MVLVFVGSYDDRGLLIFISNFILKNHSFLKTFLYLSLLLRWKVKVLFPNLIMYITMLRKNTFNTHQIRLNLLEICSKRLPNNIHKLTQKQQQQKLQTLPLPKISEHKSPSYKYHQTPPTSHLNADTTSRKRSKLPRRHPSKKYPFLYPMLTISTDINQKTIFKTLLHIIIITSKTN